uniref:26S proteasome non-ATPase regulatory subunit 5 n=1 Tax=Parascaris univalens TaxID=6257 RepID=A0A914ZVV4_PARUN
MSCKSNFNHVSGDIMRDDTGTGDEPTSAVGVGQFKGFYAIKQRFLSERSKESALTILNELTALDDGEIDSEMWMDVKDLIACLVDTITLPVLITNHQLLLLTALNRCSSRVIDFLAEYTLRHIEKIYDELSSSSIAVTIAFARRIVDAQCAQSVANLLWRFAGLNAVQEELKSRLMIANAEERFNIHQVTALVLKEGGDASKITDLVNALASEIESRDILCQLNAVELLSDAASQHTSAAEFLMTAGVVDRLYKLLQDIAEQPDAGFLFPALMKFFGHLSVTEVHCLRRYPIFLHSLFDIVHHFDILDASQRLLAFDTLAVLASTDDAKIFLQSIAQEYDMDKAMNAFGAAICSGPLELRVRHIDALTMMIRPSNTIQNEVSEIVHSWFAGLGEPFPSVLLSYASKPFPEIRIATLRLFDQLFNYDWAIKKFMVLAGFMECLLNRNIETNAEGKQLKFDVVCRLIKCGTSVILPEDLLRLKLYRREGPFHVDRPPQIDMENE